ncbi:MAG: glycosyltransferase family 39 protein, partial [Chloroflexota bacterium]|nr:glycosyltransferase family 39 protein [Chloroflexota bacterium]
MSAEPANTGSWALWIVALLLFGSAWIVWERSTQAADEANVTDDVPGTHAWGGDRLPPWIERVLILALLVFALALRLPNLDNVPPGLWFDEAQNGLVAQQLLAPGAAHPTFLGGYTQMGSLYFYFLGWVLKLFGTMVWPVRLLPALAGSALVPMLYLLAARLYGWRTGLAAAGLLAVSAWNITFSRFGIASLPTIALDVAVYMTASHALRTGRLGYFAGAGVLLGLAMQMYYAARLVPIVLAILLLHLLITQRMRLVRAVRGGLVVVAVGALLAFLPVGLFAIQQPVAFAGRVDAVSIFNPQVNGGDPNALSTNLTKHLLMFNFHGDGNGRHNFAALPQLDDVTAALFILGLGLCLLRAWRWQYFFPVVWFGAALSGGVLSLPFEAPQSHRTLEDSVVTALLAGIVLGELWSILTRPLASREPEPAQASRAAPIFRLRRTPARALTTLPTRRATVPSQNQSPIPTVEQSPAFQPVTPSARRATSLKASEPAEETLTTRTGLAWALSAAGVLVVVWWAGSITLPRYFVAQAQS